MTSENITLLIVCTAIFLMLVFAMMISTHGDIKMAESGLQQCTVTSNGYTSTIWSRECPNSKE